MHGGDIYSNPITMDFSVNVNPLGMPVSVRAALIEAIDHVCEYPDPESRELKEMISSCHGIDRDHIALGNGASELITALLHAYRPAKVMMTSPCFSGYRSGVSKLLPESRVIYHELLSADDFVVDERICDHISEEKPDLLFLTNPNNPNGRLIERQVLDLVFKTCRETGTLVVLDECFMPLTGLESKLSAVRRLGVYDNLCVLRAFTKTYAIPGVRLGYLLCGSSQMADQVNRQLPEWNISVPAQRAGVAALTDLSYVERSAQYIAEQRTYLSQELEHLGIKVYPSNANYILLQSIDIALYEKLLKKGTLIRDCSDYLGLDKGYYRVAVRTHEDNASLIEQLRDL